MKKENKFYLQDILDAVDWIVNDYIIGLDADSFSQDHKTQDSVIRQIAIIGEALNKVDKSFLDKFPELPAKDAVSMRNILVHDYDFVDTDKLWKTCQVDLPILKKIVEDVFKKIDNKSTS